jgi:uncharacterized protein YebE (UPF0316 family)
VKETLRNAFYLVAGCSLLGLLMGVLILSLTPGELARGEGSVVVGSGLGIGLIFGVVCAGGYLLALVARGVLGAIADDLRTIHSALSGKQDEGVTTIPVQSPVWDRELDG